MKLRAKPRGENAVHILPLLHVSIVVRINRSPEQLGNTLLHIVRE